MNELDILRYDIYQFLSLRYSKINESGEYLSEATNKVLRYILN